MNESSTYQTQIAERINGYAYGSAFSASDFLDIADANTINQVLNRLEKKHVIRRVLTGIYDKPAYSEIINEYSVPRIDRIAEALARKFHWNIAPSGDTALNYLHISTQVTNEWEYVSDGPYREYMIGDVYLRFRHIMPREINGYSAITIMTIQALRAIGNGSITVEQRHRFANALTDENKRTLLIESRTAANWISKEIHSICEEGRS